MTALAAPPIHVPAVDPEGVIIANAGKHARNAVLTAFEMMGGTAGLVTWAQRNAANETDFYTKLFPKVIQKEVEVSKQGSIEDVLNVIDGEYTEVPNPLPTVAAPSSMMAFDPLSAIVVGAVDEDEDFVDE